MNDGERLLLRQERDFSQKLNASFALLRLNGRAFVQGALFLVAPVLLLEGAVTGVIAHFVRDAHPEMRAVWGLVSLFAFLFGSYPVHICILGLTNGLLAETLRNDGRPADFFTAWKQVIRSRLLPYVGIQLVGAILSWTCVLPFFGYISAVGNSDRLYNPNLEIAMGLAVMVFCFGLYVAVQTLVTPCYSASAVERKGPVGALVRGFRMAGVNFWQNFLVALVTVVVATVAQLALLLPILILTDILNELTGGAESSSWLLGMITALVSAFASLGSALPFAALYAAGGVCYLSAVESTEQVGLMEKLREMGGQDPDAPSSA